MTQKEITEGNRIIAEFMGYTRDKPSGYPTSLEWSWSSNDKENPIHHPDKEAPPFNDDWSWLMPVVEKIERIGYGVSIDIKGVLIYEIHPTMSNRNFAKRNGKKIENTWLAVIEFIKWHNQQK